MKLSVPFIPDPSYEDFLMEHQHQLESLYFALGTGPVLDARIRLAATELEELSTRLAPFSIKKYALLNARFIHPDAYHDHDCLNQILMGLQLLKDHCDIAGIVFSDAYLLSALASQNKEIIFGLEAVPGINCMLDTAEKADAMIQLIKGTGFLLPGKLIADRSLNRDGNALIHFSEALKTRYRGIKIEVLANEGCIYACPFKLAHDAQISFANLEHQSNRTFAINQSFGCHRYFFDRPEQIFKSPFIRPEDMDACSKAADSIKLCGRTLGTAFLIRCINAYLAKDFSGNLLDLMDAAHWLSNLYHISNKRLDPGFWNMVTQCKKHCETCGQCLELFQKTATRKPLEIKTYKDIQ